MAASPDGTPSRPNWVDAEDLVQTRDPLLKKDERGPIAIAEDENIGATLGGKYVLQRLIGKGGMGKVFEAEHALIGRKVAIKLLRPKYARRPDIVHRFFQEARAVNQIRCEHIVEISDFVEVDEHGFTYLVMELLSGESLGQRMKREKTLPLERTLPIFIQICKALQAAHDAGIVHRDLKPDNVFLIPKATEDDQDTDFVKVLDYGVAKLMGETLAEEVGQTVVGTPAYMSPEQASAQEVDHRADIYSMGAILYRVVCGRPVFQASTIKEYVHQHLYSSPIPPAVIVAEIGGSIPPELEACILKCLAKNPAERFQSAREVRLVLEALLRKVATPDQAALQVQDPPRRAGLIWAVFLLLLLAGAATTYLLWPTGVPSEQTAPIVAPQPEPETKTPTVKPPDPPPEPKPTELQLVSRPLGAEVYRADSADTKPLGITPFKTSFQAADTEVVFVFRLKGFQEKRIPASLAKSAEVLADLERLPEPKTKPGRKDPAAQKKPEDVNKFQPLDPFSR